jgi:hypothetical protein
MGCAGADEGDGTTSKPTASVIPHVERREINPTIISII